MSKLRAGSFSVSADGYGAGPSQDLNQPLGQGGLALHEWLLATRTFQSIHGARGGTTGLDDDFAARGFAHAGTWILGRNLSGPVRGPWSDDTWKGWWGESPPYHVPVFVLTHHARAPIEMLGGTVFHVVTGGTEEALMRAREAVGDHDVRVGGRVATVRQYLRAELLDELHFAVSPILLGSGESLLVGLDLPRLGYRVTVRVTTAAAMHIVVTRD